MRLLGIWQPSSAIEWGGIHKPHKGKFIKQYVATYEAILANISAGTLVHADETKVTLRKESHFVWVFTNMDNVAYVYSNSRESNTAREVLKDFKGVLVSDFYAGYDAIAVAQQKCLIHLLRDINDDVLNNPFNDEMVEVAHSFGALLKAIIETVDQFGLKSYYLRKHKRAVALFSIRLPSAITKQRW